jgi:hypothetical protein
MSFSTQSRILLSSEYFRCKIFIYEKCLENYNDNFQKNFSRPGIIDAKARFWAAARRLRNTDIESLKGSVRILLIICALLKLFK